MDVLADILSSMRLSGGVIVDAQMAGEFCIASQLAPEDVADMAPGSTHLIGYHFVRSGRVWVETDHEGPFEAGAGSIILVPRNERHRIYSSSGAPVLDSRDLLRPGDSGVRGAIRIDGDGEAARLWCGFLGSAAPENALLEALPGLMLIAADNSGRDAWLESSLRFAAGELGAAPPEAVARLTELLFGEAVRRYLETLPEGQGGMLAGLRDPVVSRALAIVHRRYADGLDMAELAREVGLSRSALHERFVALVGEPPMRYSARWRMRVAANLLRDQRQTCGAIAFEVGFNSEAAFTRAFKREYGEPPAAWRRRLFPAGEVEPIERAKAGETQGVCRSADGASIGWSEMGEGPPLVQPAIWFHHVATDWSSATWRHWMELALERHRLIRSDLRGVGLSDATPPRWTFDALYEDFEAVAAGVPEERFDLFGLSHGALVAIAFAARHPERVRRLVLVSGYAAGFGVRGDREEIERRETLVRMGQVYRDGDRTVFGRMLGALYWPGARGEVIDWFAERLVTIMGLSEALQDVFRTVDLRPLLPAIRAETLIVHSKGDRIIPHACSEQLAESIADARLISAESGNHMLLQDEAAWPAVRGALRAFLS